MPNVMAAQPNIGGARCESSIIPFLVPRRKVWLKPAAGVPFSNAVNIPSVQKKTSPFVFFITSSQINQFAQKYQHL